MIIWTIFIFSFFVASLSSNLAYILIFFLLTVGFLFIAASYFAMADGSSAAAMGLQKAGGATCFVAGLLGWYVVFHIFVKAEWGLELPLGDTSRFFKRND